MMDFILDKIQKTKLQLCLDQIAVIRYFVRNKYN